MSLNTLSGPDSRDLSVRDPAGRIRVSAWFCQTLSEVPACYLGITRGRVRTFYLPVLPLYGFTKLFLIIYLLSNFKLPVLVLTWGLEQKKLNSCSHKISRRSFPLPSRFPGLILYGVPKLLLHGHRLWFGPVLHFSVEVTLHLCTSLSMIWVQPPPRPPIGLLTKLDGVLSP
jgi:hypothetical protein